jgi:hypothetical protein
VVLHISKILVRRVSPQQKKDHQKKERERKGARNKRKRGETSSANTKGMQSSMKKEREKMMRTSSQVGETC